MYCSNDITSLSETCVCFCWRDQLRQRKTFLNYSSRIRMNYQRLQRNMPYFLRGNKLYSVFSNLDLRKEVKTVFQNCFLKLFFKTFHCFINCFKHLMRINTSHLNKSFSSLIWSFNATVEKLYHFNQIQF